MNVQTVKSPDRRPVVIPPLYGPAIGAVYGTAGSSAPGDASVNQLPLLRWDLREEESFDADRPQKPPSPDGLKPLIRMRELPEPLPWSRNMARVLFDILAGRRDIVTIRRWIEPHLYRRLEARLRSLPNRIPQTIPARVRNARACHISDKVVETSVVVQEQGRCRAVAMRLEVFRGRWKITALEIV